MRRKKRNTFNNLFLIFYPIVAVVVLSLSNQHLHHQLEKLELQPIPIIANVLYFLSLIFFLFKFIVKKDEFSTISPILGLAGMIALAIPSVMRRISVTLYTAFHSQLLLNIHIILFLTILYVLTIVSLRYRKNFY